MSNINPDTVFGNQFTEEDSARLHYLKNAPSQPTINGLPITFPPYQFQPFPKAIYHFWTDARKRDELIQVARLNQLDLTKPLEREKAESLLPAWDSKLVHNESELSAHLSNFWTEDPNDVTAAEQRHLDHVANQAAMRRHDDLKLSAKAQAEIDAADRANGDEHLVDLPVPVLAKKRGRPTKAESAAKAASVA